jgi:hypothetical protein
MLEITIDTSAAGAVALAIQRLPRRLTRNIAEVLREEAREVARDARARLRGAGRGTPSQPGEAPARQTGALARSIRFRAARRDRLAYAVSASADSGGGAFYGRFLETGTSRGLAPRPFLSPALDARRPVTLRRLEAAIAETLAAVNRVVR